MPWVIRDGRTAKPRCQHEERIRYGKEFFPGAAKNQQAELPNLKAGEFAIAGFRSLFRGFYFRSVYLRGFLKRVLGLASGGAGSRRPGLQFKDVHGIGIRTAEPGGSRGFSRNAAAVPEDIGIDKGHMHGHGTEPSPILVKIKGVSGLMTVMTGTLSPAFHEGDGDGWLHAEALRDPGFSHFGGNTRSIRVTDLASSISLWLSDTTMPEDTPSQTRRSVREFPM